MASGPITSWQIDGETMETVRDYFGAAPKSLQMVTAAVKFKDACSLEEKFMTNLEQHIIKQRHNFANPGPSGQKVMVFPVVVYGCES